MTWILRKYPMFVLGACLVATATAVVRGLLDFSGPWQRLAAVFAGLHLVWLLLEAWTTVRSSQSTDSATDRGTLYVYGTARTATLVAACLPAADNQAYRPWLLALPVVFVGAVGLRLWAIHTLGRYYSHRVRVLGDHEIVRTGPYRVVRHPAYLGMALAHVVFVLFFLNTYSAAALMVLLATMVVRILIEERTLLTLPGYSDYAATHRRVIPWVW
ncbi:MULTISPECIES: methyltransferase family protein [Streptomyces]|uniref:Isoprenylcysteine carboxylmethyltransferase family protein n=1 Tax=Streptomyces rhizosphaericus TaxID=114699 RepID=A0A6G4ATU4_9ACTN|nr:MULTISPECIES: isoprenylcysteine carboxylmethyltransferase family protein [Streptomyces]EXU62121.1 guanylate kinase [Streptomyces sp. PRh5]NEW76896.1 isoprenylcysteine carboxylmethyltransferase family protein [Streptomyces rhizosphaericus]TMU98313.1 isoprenylcysteine carboxylmethyltransferase family protein [Streptomyces sp. DASNCL29]